MELYFYKSYVKLICKKYEIKIITINNKIKPIK